MLSLIIPTYNGIDYLDEMVRSVLSQLTEREKADFIAYDLETEMKRLEERNRG